MICLRASALAAVLAVALLSTPAAANDDALELWLNPSASLDLDDDTGLELETAQRFRSAGDGRPDTYFARFWVNQDVSDAVTLSAAVERRINSGDDDETRTMQQMSTAHGILRTRLRLEQRFVDDADRMGLRLRPRLGVEVPLTQDGRLSFESDAELFVTLRSTSRGGDTGATGLRTHIGMGYEASDRLSLSAGYLRQQDFEEGGRDVVGHAPILGLELSF